MTILTYSHITAMQGQIEKLARRGKHQEIIALIDGLSDTERESLFASDKIKKAAESAHDLLLPRRISKVRAVSMLKELGHTEEAQIIKNGWIAVQERDKEGLLEILETINHLHGTEERALQFFLERAAEVVSAVLLEIMQEDLQRAHSLLRESFQEKGFRRTGLLNDFREAEEQAVVFFPIAGIKAIDRLIKKNQLPKCVADEVEMERIKECDLPVPELFRHMRARPKIDQTDRDHAYVVTLGQGREGKTQRYKSRNPNAESARRARQLERAAAQPTGMAIKGKKGKKSK